MEKWKQLFISLGLGILLLLGAASTVSAAALGKLEGSVFTEDSEEITLEDYDMPAGRAVSPPPTDSVRKTASTLTSISLKWDAAKGANAYRIYIGPYKATSGFKYLGTTKSSSCKISQILPGTPYTIRILAVRTEKVNGKETVVEKAKSYIRFYVSTKDPAINQVTTNSKGLFTVRMYNPAPSDKADNIIGYKVTYVNMQKNSTATKYYNTRTGFSYTPRENTFYKLSIRPYITVNGKKSYSTATLTRYIAQQPKLSKKGHTSTRQTISWKRVYGADAYNVYVKYPGTSSYKRVKRTAGLSYTLTGLKKGQTYYVKVVAYRGKSASANSIYYPLKL